MSSARLGSRPLALAVWLLAALALPAPGTSQQPSDGDAAALGSIESVGFLAGCWAGVMGSLDLKEQWTEPHAGIMLGTTRFFRNGELVDFEFGMFRAGGGVVTMWPYPGGVRSADGFPLVRTDPELVFENLEHDFPVRIVYARSGADGLAPRIEGPNGEARGWSLRRVPCPG